MAMTDKAIENFLLAQEVGGVCAVCENKDFAKLLERILKAMIKKGKRRASIARILEITNEQTESEITPHQFEKHLKRCVNSLWKEAKHGRRVQSGRMARGTGTGGVGTSTSQDARTTQRSQTRARPAKKKATASKRKTKPRTRNSRAKKS